jgi:YrbI family 3-deoxy-D-manno-octulosonate 8-phosphate phosphatase
VAKPAGWPPLAGVHTIAFDFDGVFTDNKVYVSADGTELVRCDRADGLAIDMLRAAQSLGRLRADVFVLSKERNPVAEVRARKLGLACQLACDDKLDFVSRRLREARPSDPQPFSGLVYVGNDLNDLPVMARAGFSVAPADAHARVRETASLVLPQQGGDGFVRAFVEGLLGFERMGVNEVHALVHHGGKRS